MNQNEARKLLKSLGVKGTSKLKSNRNIYGKAAPSNVFTFEGDSAWFCKIHGNGTICVNDRHFCFPLEILKYNEKIIKDGKNQSIP